MPRSILLCSPEQQADVWTSRGFPCQIFLCLLLHLTVWVLSLQWLWQQIMGHLYRLTFKTLLIRLVVFCKGCCICFEAVHFSIPIGRQKQTKKTVACILTLRDSCFSCRNLIGLVTTFSFLNKSFIFRNCPLKLFWTENTWQDGMQLLSFLSGTLRVCHYIDFKKQTICSSVVWLLNRLCFSPRMTTLYWKTTFGFHFLVGGNIDHSKLMIH